ncbi:hypothetical protein JKF63_07654 [Porcisia hertigi]|uniref:Uncharacterized protein n=1 Tax=Porcisia hertigi TaxID=2761500 RepID=A0A836IXN1_9TRYP|nr:hypothetical protein JKF63_07654 [Porcisia hertigi]
MVGPDGHQYYNYSSNTGGGGGGGNIMALTRLDSHEILGTSSSFPNLQLRHHSDPIVPLVARPSLDSIGDLVSSASPISLPPASSLSLHASKDSITVQDYCTHQSQQSLQRSLSLLYPQVVSPSSPFPPSDPFSRGPDFTSARGVSATEEDANEDRVQVRVEGFYESNSVGLLIPNDLPRSTLLYVLTASDGRDLLFKLMQYTLQLAICFLHTPSLFSPEVQGLTAPMAERLYRNYNTIRHGRSLFKMGRGLLNLFMLQGVLERMRMKYEKSIADLSCAVMLSIASGLEKTLVWMGVSPMRSRSLSLKPLRWAQATKATLGLSPSESPEPSALPDGHAQPLMSEHSSTSPVYSALLVDNTHAPTSKVNPAGGNVIEVRGCRDSRSGTPQLASLNVIEEDSTTKMFAESSDVHPRITGHSGVDKDVDGALPLPLPLVLSRVSSSLVDAALTKASGAEQGSDKSGTKIPHTMDTPASSAEFTQNWNGLSPPPACMTAATDEFDHTTAVSVPAPRAHLRADRFEGAGRKTLLHPLRPASKSDKDTSTASTSNTSNDLNNHIHTGVEGHVVHDDTPLMPAPHSLSYGSMTNSLMPELASGGGLMPGEGPLSGPNHWHIACAPTVPPSHSENFAATLSTPHTTIDLSTLKPDRSSYAAASTSEATSKTDDTTTGSTCTVGSAHTRLPPQPLTCGTDITTTQTQTAMASVDDELCKGQPALNGHPASALALTTYTGAPLTPNRTQAPRAAGENKESDISILASSTNSSLHVRGQAHATALSDWLRELQPASAALPARWRKGASDFNVVLMTLLGIRNLAAACRRFLRDVTILSTEKFGSFTFVEVHRHTITRIINRCWFVVSIIDVILNTVRLLQPGWVKYATARENIHCRCGCGGDDDPFDVVWRTHGCIARRKTDLFFPPLDLDYGAPFVSSLSYLEAADPAKLMPACSRCGFLYREVQLDSEQEGDEAEVGDKLGGASTPLAQRTASTPATAASFSEDGHRAGSHRHSKKLPFGMAGSMEREKPRWVQLYNEEVKLGESQLLQSSLRNSETRRETLTPSSGVRHNASEQHRESSGTRSNMLKGCVAAEQSADEMHQRRKSSVAVHELPSQRSSGILFVPWIMRKFFDYLWLLRIHPNLTSTVLLEARCLAELFLSYKYCFGGFETFRADAPLSAILNPYGALAGIVSAAVGLLRVIESAPSS